MEANKYKSNVGLIWVADETVIDLDGKNIWFWDIIDTKTRFLIALHMSRSVLPKTQSSLCGRRTSELVIPRLIYTDKLRAYLYGIVLTFGADTKHGQGGSFDAECNTNLIERFHGTIKSSTKVMRRGLHTIEPARLFMDGWLVHYNFFRLRMSLRDMTPTQAAGINFPFGNW